MTIIKNHFEVFLVTSRNGIIESKVGLYNQFTFVMNDELELLNLVTFVL
jgi:hypothetical protein